MSQSKKRPVPTEVAVVEETHNNQSPKPLTPSAFSEEENNDYSSCVQDPAFSKSDDENANITSSQIFSNSSWVSRQIAKKRQTVISKKDQVLTTAGKRWGHTSVVYEKFLYVQGGCVKQQDASKNLQQYRFDCETWEWEKIETTSEEVPENRDSHTANLLGNKIWMFGGSSIDYIYNEIWTFDIQLNIWTNQTMLFKGDIPSPRESHVAAVIQDRYLIIIGGFNIEQSLTYQDVYVIDTKNKTSKKIGTIRMPVRHSQSASVIDDAIYLFGGHGNSGDYYNDLFLLRIDNIKKSPSLNVEEIKPKGDFIPPKRALHQQVSFQNRYIFIIGGEKEGVNQEGLSDVWVYDCRMNFWSQVRPRCPRGIHFSGRFTFSCSIYKNKIYLYGGLQNQSILLENLSVLQLRDDTKQKLIETRQTCVLCQSLFSTVSPYDIISQHQYDTMGGTLSHEGVGGQNSKLQEINKLYQVEDIDKQSQQFGVSSEAISLPFTNGSNSLNYKYLSLEFVKQLASMISSPFSAIGMLFDFLFSFSNSVYISIKDSQNPLLTSLILYQQTSGIETMQLQQLIYQFAQCRRLQFDEYNKDRECYFKANEQMIQTLEQSYQIKLAGCRLGDIMVLESTHSDVYSIAFFNFISNPTDTFQILSYSFNQTNNHFLTELGSQNKSDIDSLIEKYNIQLTHKSSNTQGVTITITKLTQMPDIKQPSNQQSQSSNIECESVSSELLFDSEKNDLTLNAPTFIGGEGFQQLTSTIDYSFKSFSSLYYLTPQQSRSLYLNNEKITFNSYTQQLFTLSQNSTTLLPLFTQAQSVPYSSPFGKVALFSISNSINQNIPVSDSSILNGCLAYYDNKFVFRFYQQSQIGYPSILRLQNKIMNKKPIFKINGSLLLDESLKPNIIGTVNKMNIALLFI